jgi:ribonuclease HIII
MSKRLDQDREKQEQPKRVQFAKDEIEKLGYEIITQDETKLVFQYKGHNVTLYPYSGWFTGKMVTDGRGIHKLLNQIKNK